MLEQGTIKKAIETHHDQFIHDLSQIIAIPSVRGKAEAHAPFGRQPREALNTIVRLAQNYGFKTGIVNDAMAYVQWGDDDDHYFGVVGHLDVVAAGRGWTSDPFKLVEREGRYYARGILDNKGPAFSCLFGMKLLKDLGVRPQRTVRIIFGSDEESGSADIPLYLQDEAAPEFGFTPDCKYPAVYGERGIVNYRIHTPLAKTALAQLTAIEGDQAKDHVPDQLSLTIQGQSVSARGKRSPSNAPELGQNALTLLAKKITTQKLAQGELAAYFQWITDKLHNQHHGEGLGLDFHDEDSGELIMTPYQLTKANDGLDLELAIRYPVSFKEAQITTGLQKAVPAGSQITVIRSMPSVMHDKNAPFIQVLSRVYEAVTGLDGTPVTTTGATYARSMPHIIAFGPSFPGQKGIAHKQDEWMAVKDLDLNMEIYMQAIMNLISRKEHV